MMTEEKQERPSKKKKERKVLHLVTTENENLFLDPNKQLSNKEMADLLELKFGWKFKFNSVKMKEIANDQDMTDTLFYKVSSDFRKLGELHPNFLDKTLLKQVIGAISMENKFNPVQDYLTSCVIKYQDEKIKDRYHEPFEDMMSCIQTDEDRGVVQAFLKRWLYGCIGRVTHNFQNYVLVLVGPQGAYKSSFCSWLCSGLGKEYFQEGQIILNDKDHTIRLATKWIWSVSELGGSLRSADRSKMKDFLTREIVSERLPYAKYQFDADRLCNFIASENDKEILSDPTGNRRYLVFNIEKVMMDRLREAVPIDQLWGQLMYECIMAEFKEDGQPIWFLSEQEREWQKQNNTEAEIEDPMSRQLMASLKRCEGAFVLSSEVLLRYKGHSARGEAFDPNDRVLAMKISDAMKKLGFEKDRRRIKGERQYIYIGCQFSDSPAQFLDI